MQQQKRREHNGAEMWDKKYNKNTMMTHDDMNTIKVQKEETLKYNIQGGPAKVRPTYIFDGNIWIHIIQ